MVRAGVAFVVAVLAISPGAAAEIRATAQLIPIALLDTGGRVLQVSPYEVTVASWRQCFDSGGCTHLPVRPSASGQLPVTGVNWFDVNEYLAWTNSKDGGEVRLPSLSEWREIARSIAHERPKVGIAAHSVKVLIALCPFPVLSGLLGFRDTKPRHRLLPSTCQRVNKRQVVCA